LSPKNTLAYSSLPSATKKKVFNFYSRSDAKLFQEVKRESYHFQQLQLKSGGSIIKTFFSADKSKLERLSKANLFRLVNNM